MAINRNKLSVVGNATGLLRYELKKRSKHIHRSQIYGINQAPAVLFPNGNIRIPTKAEDNITPAAEQMFLTAPNGLNQTATGVYDNINDGSDYNTSK